MVWGWIIAMAFIQCVASSLAELCSSMPTRSELYSQSVVWQTLTLLLQRWPLLCVGSSCTPWLGPCCILGHWLVQLDWTSHKCTIGQLCCGGNDSRCSVDNRREFRIDEVPVVPPHHSPHDHSKLHQQHANQMGCCFQFLGVYFEHDSGYHCHHSHTYRHHKQS